MRPFAYCLILAVQSSASLAFAQPRSTQYFPVDHRNPGVAAHWNVTIDPSRATRVQPVEFTLPPGVLIASGAQPFTPGPVSADLAVGQTYRFRVSEIEGYPGVEIYPSVELIDSLHAPEGKEREFPVPVTLTIEDLEAALQNRLVTKVIYIEQPDLAIPISQDGVPLTTEFSPRTNLMKAADERGRPIAIVRLGGRQEIPGNPGTNPPETEVILTPVGKATVNRKNGPALSKSAGQNAATALAATETPEPSRPFPE